MSNKNANAIGSPSQYSWDVLFIIGAPAISFFLISTFSRPRWGGDFFLYDPETPLWFIGFAGLITHFHVAMVFVRSHLNRQIFAKYPYRFIAVPILGLIALTISPLISGIMVVVALYWDEWHTQMQTFGFARIFDARNGNNPNIGRKLDMMMIFVLGLFPHMILLTFLPENIKIEALTQYLSINVSFIENYGHYLAHLRYPLILFAIGFCFFYIAWYRQLLKQGYKISKKKLALMATTAICTLAVACFYSLADGFYFFNIYHSLQYIYLVFLSETELVAQRFGNKNLTKDWAIYGSGLFIFVVVLLLAIARDEIGILFNVWLMSSLLHFWYDGFIWSVRRQEI